MEFWHTHPTESDLHFAQTINPIKPVETAANSLLEAKPLPASPTKFLTDMASEHASLPMIPPMKQIKTEGPSSPRCGLYRGWLEVLRQIASKLASGQENSNSARFPEFLKYVIVKLEHKLAVDDFKTQGSEWSFWASIQDMCKRCDIDFCEFERLCCSSVSEVTSALDSSIPKLVDQGLDSPSSEFVGCSLASNMASQDVFQRYPQGTANDISYTSPNSASFEQLPFEQHQRQMAIVKHPEQGNLCTPGFPYSTFSTPNVISLENSNTQVPATCKRRVQRQRKRAISYSHLSTNFGASSSSLTWNTSIAGASDLQFLLEKELKPSDVGSLGRIILPKRQAEENLPHLEAKEGVKMSFQDLQTSQIWELRFRFWPNNKTRMYLLESTGNFVKSHHLQEGDFVQLYRNPATGTYMINAKKATWPKCLGTSERRSLPSLRENIGSEKSSFGPGRTVERATENESGSAMQLLLSGNEGNSGHDEDGDLMAWDMEDPDELIKGFSEIGGRSIDELFD